jgi:predicted NAD/FAD-dependent oxidoreductase
MHPEKVETDILVVGAGISGLIAANALQYDDISFVAVDKGRSVGGRLATRRIGPGRADHGAQFFTIRSPEFQNWTERWLMEGLVYRWSNGWSDGSLAPTDFHGHPRYAVRGGMNALAKYLARDIDIQVNLRLTAATATSQGWQCRADNGQLFLSKALLLTPPVPQSLALLEAGQTELAAADRAALEQIEYAPCLAGMYWLDGPVHLPEPGAIQHSHAPISWIADNQRKGISPEATIVTVHAGPTYSRELWDSPEAETLTALQTGFRPYVAATTSVVEAQLKRWRYALPTTLHPERCLLAANLPPLVFAGDGFKSPRVEGAALSGLAASQMLASRI